MQNPLQILLVEDDPDDVELLESALQSNGIPFQTTVITEGDKVLPYLQLCKNFPTVIVLDLNLPKMHGKQVLAQIMELDNIKQIPVVIMTTSSAPSDKEFCYSTGAAEYIIKPVTMQEFNDAVLKIVARASS